MFDHHTGEIMFDMVNKLLIVFCPDWTIRLIGLVSDGVRNMTDHVTGIVIRLDATMHDDCPLTQIWCGAHQLNLVMEHIMNDVVKERFFTIMTGFITHITRHVATPLWGKCEDETCTPKSGNLESSETPETSEFDCRGQNTSHCGIPYIIGKILKCKCRKWARMSHLDICNTSYGKKKGWESNHSDDILGARMLWKPKEARILKNFINQPV
jgi:hypothetical protein